MWEWRKLTWLAQRETERVLTCLPSDLRVAAGAVAILFERRPGPVDVSEGIAPDSLGAFFGPTHAELDTCSACEPPRIVLYLENILEDTGPDPRLFAREVRKTFLHELGHYLGLDEYELELRDML